MAIIPCPFDNCCRPVITGGLCDGHYRQRQAGKPLTPLRKRGGSKPRDVGPRLIKRRDINPESGCWIWTGSRTSNGYGQIYKNGRNIVVHRAAFEYWVGPVGEDTVHHKCAERLCFNPEHLQLATLRENIGEMHARKAYQRQIRTLESQVAELSAEVSELRAVLEQARDDKPRTIATPLVEWSADKESQPPRHQNLRHLKYGEQLQFDEFLENGRVTAWRALLIVEGRIVALSQSYMWR